MAHLPSDIRARAHDCPINDGEQGSVLHLFVTQADGNTVYCLPLRYEDGRQSLIEGNPKITFPNGDCLSLHIEFAPGGSS